MPGRLVASMSSLGAHGANGTGSTANGKNAITNGTITGPSQSASSNSQSHTVNGDHAPNLSTLRNGNGHSAHLTNGAMDIDGPSQGPNLSSALSDLPPELLHITDGYMPLSTLLSRVTQQSYLDFADLLDRTSIIPVQAQNQSLVNGASSAGPPVGVFAKNNDTKKLEWLNWINSNREKFIKLSVIWNWTKQNGDSIKTLIDLMMWSNAQHEAYREGAAFFGHLKRNLYGFRLRNPDIPTALEALATGKVDKFPDVRVYPICSIAR